MATDSAIRISGLAELDRVLKTLPARVEGNVMRGALRAGQSVIRDGAAAELAAAGAIDDGALRASLRISLSRRSVKYGWLRMNLIAGNRKPMSDPSAVWYAHFVEFGTASFYTGKGRSVGKPYRIEPTKAGALHIGAGLREGVTHPGIRPRKFMRRAFDKQQRAALEAVAAYLRKRVPREAAKLRKTT